MPINNPLCFRKLNFDQSTLARATGTLAGVRPVGRAMAGAQQPPPLGVEHAVRLPVQLHRDMGAAIKVGMGDAFETDGKSAASLSCVHHIERNSQSALLQVTGIA